MSTYTKAKTYDIGELNERNHNVLRARFNNNVSALTQMRSFFKEHFGYDQFPDHRGPFEAVVLKVLAGPQAYNDASTNGRGETKCLRMKGLETFDDEELIKAGHPSLVRIIAKVPQFDVDIGWPKTFKIDGEASQVDFGRISVHGEYQALEQNSKLTGIRPGHVVFIRFTSEYWTSNLSGRPAGILLGPGPGGASQFEGTIKEITRAKYEPKCKVSRELLGPTGPLYIGKTVTDVQPGPPIRRIKGRLKTGIFGDGTENTKAHFAAAMSLAPESYKHKIPGPAPGPDNAFIWIGHLRNNGYLDLLDRPHTPGRETIIYASKMLDLSAPIEIKYYLHNDGGFGHAWLKGPTTTPSESKELAVTPGNDFREKIGPGMKDLIKEKRNIILVIPEMMYSKGFGTGRSSGQRMQKIAQRDPPYTEGEHAAGLTVRTKLTDQVLPYAKEYLSGLQASDGESLLSVTRLRDREFSTFDGSITGGNFHLFHQEVLDVLKQYLGIDYDKIDFVSILADGLGAVNLAAIAQSVPASATHVEAENGLRLVNIQKIDFIDIGLDRDISIGPGFVAGDLGVAPGGFYVFPYTPSYTLYTDYLTLKAENPAQKMEFNYITEYAGDKPKTNRFFDLLGHGDKYRQNFVNTATAQRKFSIFVEDVENSKSTISLHLTKNNEQVGYAFSMINDFSGQSGNYPLKSVSNSAAAPSTDTVPNHAEAINTKSGPLGLEQIVREMIKLEEEIQNFEDVLAIPSLHNGDWGKICGDDNPEYKTYCKEGFFYRASDGPFAKAYAKYFENKRRYMELKHLSFFEQQAEILVTKESVQQQLTEYEVILQTHTTSLDNKQPGADSPKDLWNKLKKTFKPEYFSSKAAFDNMINQNVDQGYIALVAETIAYRDAVEKYIQKLLNKRKQFKLQENPEVPVDCAIEPVLLKDMFMLNKAKLKGVKSTAIVAAASKCGDITVKRPSTYTEMATMVPYFPVKEDFMPFVKAGSAMKSKKATSLTTLPGFKLDRFKYKARADSPRGNKSRTIRSYNMWSCLKERLEEAWQHACEISGYIPFRANNGARGYGVNSRNAATAYGGGVSCHALGLAFDMDASFTGYNAADLRHSIFTGAWTPGIGDNPLLGPKSDIYPAALGVFSNEVSQNVQNIYTDGMKSKGSLLVKDRFQATDLYGPGEGYPGMKTTLDSLARTPIVPPEANPTLWAIVFCERSGMIWGNGHFLKKRYSGTAWSPYDFNSHRSQLDEIYGIEDVAMRIKRISWLYRRDDHMHFQFWKKGSLFRWAEIANARKKITGE